MLDMRLGEPAEIAELRAAERLHARPRRQRYLGEVSVVGAVIDAVVKGFVDFVVVLRVAALDQHAQFFVDILERAPLHAGHALGGKAGAKRLQFRHDFEHAGELLRARPRHDGGAVGAHFHQPARRQHADRFTHRRARNFEAARQRGFVERGAGRERAAHDFVGELQAQFLRARLARPADVLRRGVRRHEAHAKISARPIICRSNRRMRNRRQEIARVARFRRFHNAFRGPLFDDFSRLHDDDTIAQKPHHVEVVRDEKIAHAE